MGFYTNMNAERELFIFKHPGTESPPICLFTAHISSLIFNNIEMLSWLQCPRIRVSMLLAEGLMATVIDALELTKFVVYSRTCMIGRAV